MGSAPRLRLLDSELHAGSRSTNTQKHPECSQIAHPQYGCHRKKSVILLRLASSARQWQFWCSAVLMKTSICHRNKNMPASKIRPMPNTCRNVVCRGWFFFAPLFCCFNETTLFGYRLMAVDVAVSQSRFAFYCLWVKNWAVCDSCVQAASLNFSPLPLSRSISLYFMRH